MPSVSTWMSQRNLKLNMLKNRVSIFFPCPQSYFPFSVNDRTSIWSPKSHSEHPSFVPHQTLSPDNSTPSASLPLLLLSVFTLLAPGTLLTGLPTSGLTPPFIIVDVNYFLISLNSATCIMFLKTSWYKKAVKFGGRSVKGNGRSVFSQKMSSEF